MKLIRSDGHSSGDQRRKRGRQLSQLRRLDEEEQADSTLTEVAEAIYDSSDEDQEGEEKEEGETVGRQVSLRARGSARDM